MAVKKEEKSIIVGLDIGTSKVVAAVAEVHPDGRYDVIGLGSQESKGLKKGVVVNIEATVGAIQRALEEAELMADCKIQTVFTGIAGTAARSVEFPGQPGKAGNQVHPLVLRVIPIETGQHALKQIPRATLH